MERAEIEASEETQIKVRKAKMKNINK